MLTTRPARDWARELNAIGVPAGAVMSVPEILEHPQVRDRDFLSRFEAVPGVGRPIDLVRIAAMFDGVRPGVKAPPPALGADTDDILRDLGYCGDEIGAMRRKGVI